MWKRIMLVAVVGGAGGAAYFLHADPAFRQALAVRIVDGVARTLGVEKPAAEQAAGTRKPGKVALPSSQPPRGAAQPNHKAPAPSPSTGEEEGAPEVPVQKFVDRSPVPSAVERVRPEDQKRLQAIIDQKLRGGPQAH